MEAPGALRSARSDTPPRPFIGTSSSDVPAGLLPSIEAALRVVAWHREQPKCDKKKVRLFCCPISRNRAALCQEEGGCCERGDPCLLFKVKKPYIQACVLTVTDECILLKLEKSQAEIIL